MDVRRFRMTLNVFDRLGRPAMARRRTMLRDISSADGMASTVLAMLRPQRQ